MMHSQKNMQYRRRSSHQRPACTNRNSGTTVRETPSPAFKLKKGRKAKIHT